MDPNRNPCAPGAGSQPPELAGRDFELETARVALARTRGGRFAKSMIAVGLRGVGKTVLLRRIADIARETGYRVVFIEAPEGKRLPDLLVPKLRQVLLDLDRLGAVSAAVKRALRLFKSFTSAVKLSYDGVDLGLSIAPETGVADTGQLEIDLPDLLTAVGSAAKSRDVPIAILIDEMQYLTEPELGALIMSVHQVVQEALPIVLFGAGLPQIVGLAADSKTYAERLFGFPAIDALSRPDAEKALVAPATNESVTWDTAAVEAVIDVTRAYPYFLQTWGYQAWNVAADNIITNADVDAATVNALRDLDQNFFRARFDRLTPGEKRYMRAMADLGPGPHRSGDIAARLGVKVFSAGRRRQDLIGKGMIYSPHYGDTAFTVPLFDEFLRRTMPTFDRDATTD